MKVGLPTAHDGVAVITGAAGGIGLGLARAAVAEGLAVVISDLEAARLEAAAAQLSAEGACVRAHPADVTDAASVQKLVGLTTSEFGRIDLVCLNAGIAEVATPIGKITTGVWDRVMAVNFHGVLHGIRAVLPILQRQGYGHINATASVNGLMADPGIAAYAASKFAVVGLMETLALDLARDNSPVTASVLCPGPIATDIIKRAVGKDLGTRDVEHELLNRGMDPDQAGRIALAGIRSGRFWIFTHPVMADLTLRDRFEAMVTDGSRPADLSWPWDEVLDREE